MWTIFFVQDLLHNFTNLVKGVDVEVLLLLNSVKKAALELLTRVILFGITH